ncbi:hypothetical protein [Leptospira perolatii]|uniref:hypothetical protein n=1 Tax=Leptospira perolatii TaxID=2023191 RepID=UPI001FAEE6C7|nr:hypothetical protein [Leptospira perolatii]
MFHGEAATIQNLASEDAEVKEHHRIAIGNSHCKYPVLNLKLLSYQPDFRPMNTNLDHSPKSLSSMLSREDLERVKEYRKFQLYRYYPTYYHLALEVAYPGKDTSVISPMGKEIGRASAHFLEQVKWEGSGVAADGKKYHFAGNGRYELYNLEWGWGAGYKYQVYPYRTIAISFGDLCKKLGRLAPENCNKSKVIGTLFYFPGLAKKKIRMEDGKLHDGYFCANDTGSPEYIRGDRMDIFVGVHGGGSPYQPKELSRNLFFDAGVPPLVPSDWRYYTSEKERTWCSEENIPKDPFHPASEECSLDYHANAPQKGWEAFVFLRKDGSLVRCNP